MRILKGLGCFATAGILAGAAVLPLAAQTLSPPNAGPAVQSPRSPVQNPLVSLAVFSSDGNKVGTVDSVDGEPDGTITAINVKTGGFLGLGARVVAIPEGKFKRAGTIVQIDMTAEEVNKLPALKDQT